MCNFYETDTDVPTTVSEEETYPRTRQLDVHLRVSSSVDAEAVRCNLYVGLW